MLHVAEILKSGTRVFSRTSTPPDELARLFQDRNVLIVEDEFFVGLDMAQTLEDMGASVGGPVTDLAGAEELLQEKDFDLVLLDVNLEGETTLDLAADLKKQDVPVAFVTAYAAASSLFGPEHDGIPRLGKPTSKRDLIRVAADLLN